MSTTSDTIFALSSGRPPAAIAVVRVSGPHAANALMALAGKIPQPRQAMLARLRDPAGEAIDDALVLWFPGPASETGEDTAELQLHGGRAVVTAALTALGNLAGLRPAEAGELIGGDVREVGHCARILHHLGNFACFGGVRGNGGRQKKGWQKESSLMTRAKP